MKLLNQGFLVVKFITSKVLPPPLRLGFPLRNMCYHGYVPFVTITISSFPHSWLITVLLIKVTRLVPLLETDLPTLPEHLSLPPVYYGFLLHNLLVFCVVFLDHYLSFCRFSVGHCTCIVCHFFDLRLLIVPLILSDKTLITNKLQVKRYDKDNINT